MKNKFLSYLMFFVMISLIASMLLLNVYGVSEDSIDIGDYNHSFSFSASYNPNITLYSITSDNSITLQTTEGTSFNAFKDERTMTDDDINDCNNEIMSGDYEIAHTPWNVGNRPNTTATAKTDIGSIALAAVTPSSSRILREVIIIPKKDITK